MKTKAKEVLIRIGKSLGPFLLRHKFGVLVAAVLIYFLIWPKSVPRLSTDNPRVSVAKTTEGRSKQSKQSAADVPLYDSTAEGADPKWSLPVELTSEKLQALARRVDKLEHDADQAQKLGDEQMNLMGDLLDDKVNNILWPGIKGNGFKDRKLPLDWYEVVKDRYEITDVPAVTAGFMADLSAMVTLRVRLKSAHVRLIGGRVTAGDTLFVNGFQGYIDQRLAYLSKVVPQLESMLHRLADEFPGQLGQMMPTLAQEYPDKFKSAEQYGGPEKVRDFALTDLGSNGFKSLVLGMSLDDVHSGYQKIKEDGGDDSMEIRYSFDNWIAIGPYPLNEITVLLYQRKVYQILLTFDKNQREISEIFHARFEPTQINGASSDSTQLQPMYATHSQVHPYSVSFTPSKTSPESSAPWQITFLDGDLSVQARRATATHP